MAQFEIGEIPQLPDNSEELANISKQEDAVSAKADETIAFIEGTAASYMAVAKKQAVYASQLDNVQSGAREVSNAIASIEYDRQIALESALGLSFKQQQELSNELANAEREIIQETIADTNKVQEANNLGIMDLITSPIDTMTRKAEGKDAEKNLQANARASQMLAQSRANIDRHYTDANSKMVKSAQFRTKELQQMDKELQALNYTGAQIIGKRTVNAESMQQLKETFGFNDAVLRSLNTQLTNLGKRRDVTMRETENILRKAQMEMNLVTTKMAVENYNRDDKQRKHGDALMASLAPKFPSFYNEDGTTITLAEYEERLKLGMYDQNTANAVAFAIKYDGDSNATVLASDNPIDDIKTATAAGGTKLNLSEDVLHMAAIVDQMQTSKGLTVAGQVQEQVLAGAKASPELHQATQNKILKQIITEVDEGDAKTIYGNGFGKMVAPTNFPDSILSKMPEENVAILKSLEVVPDNSRPENTARDISRSLSQQVVDGKISSERASSVFYDIMQGYLHMTQASSAIPVDKLVFSGLEGANVPLDLTDSIQNHQYFGKMLSKTLSSRMKEVRPDGSIGNNFIPFTNKF